MGLLCHILHKIHGVIKVKLLLDMVPISESTMPPSALSVLPARYDAVFLNDVCHTANMKIVIAFVFVFSFGLLLLHALFFPQTLLRDSQFRFLVLTFTFVISNSLFVLVGCFLKFKNYVCKLGHVLYFYRMYLSF